MRLLLAMLGLGLASSAYVHSLRDLKEIGRVFVGHHHPEWLTFTPDGRLAYAAAGDNQTFVVDTKRFKEVARINVEQVPKRIGTAVLQTF